MAYCTNYDKKLQVETLTGTADAHGFIDDTLDANWSTRLMTFASCKSKGGREFWKVDQVNADVSHVWTCPWTTALAATTPDSRLISEGITYQIMSVVDIDNAHQEVELQTRRAV